MRFTGMSGRLRSSVLSPKFEWLAAVVILANAFLVGLQVQVAAFTLSNDPPWPLQVAHLGFTAFYVVELQLRVWAQGLRRFLFPPLRHRGELFWNIFDVVIVSASVLEVVLAFTSEYAKENAKFLLVVRIARLIRIIRIVRSIVFFRELRMMVYSIFHTLKSLGWSFVLIATVMYLFAIVLTQATTDFLQRVPVYQLGGEARMTLDVGEHCGSLDERVRAHYADACVLRDRFGGLWSSMLTLFESISGGVSWGERASLLAKMHWTYEAYFIVFISFTLFAMMNVITGFFCEKAVDMAARDRESVVQEQLRNKEQYVKEMEALFRDIDTDGSGTICLEEFERTLLDDKVQAYFSSLQLDISAAWDIFRLLDRDGNHSVDVAEFALGCLRLRGHARTIDLASVQYEVEKMAGKLSYFMAYVECQFQNIFDNDELRAEGGSPGPRQRDSEPRSFPPKSTS